MRANAAIDAERALLMARELVDGETPAVPAAAAKIIHALSQQALDTHVPRPRDRSCPGSSATKRRGRTPLGNDPRHRSDWRDGAGCFRHRSGSVPLGPAFRSLAWPDTAAELEWRQGTARADQQDGRQIPAQAARDRRRRRWCVAPGPSPRPLIRTWSACWAQAGTGGDRGDGQQDGTDRLGRADAR